MGSLSAHARTALVEHFRNKGAYSPAATHYFAAFVAGVEVSGNNYARASATNNATTWPNAASRAKALGVDVTFPNPSASWGSIDEIRIYDHAIVGNELARHTLAAPILIANPAKPLNVKATTTIVTAAPGALTDTVIHELLNLMFGAVANAPRATVHGTYFAGAPPGGSERSAHKHHASDGVGCSELRPRRVSGADRARGRKRRHALRRVHRRIRRDAALQRPVAGQLHAARRGHHSRRRPSYLSDLGATAMSNPFQTDPELQRLTVQCGEAIDALARRARELGFDVTTRELLETLCAGYVDGRREIAARN